MSNEQILKFAIEKAFGDCTEEYAKSQIERDGGYRIIFSRDFAKAFWGKELVCECHGKPPKTCYGTYYYSNTLPSWQYHLLKMVLEKEPLKYLEKFLDE